MNQFCAEVPTSGVFPPQKLTFYCTMVGGLLLNVVHAHFPFFFLNPVGKSHLMLFDFASS
jgi:hypothetical protein